ncbi:MAG: hypothetical protein GC136_09035 [Alphaproteobacteria bacterium]|nr:hypothetical protein [Alphaproteobacteria bacterium]
MAAYTDHFIRAKTYVLMAQGKNYRQEDTLLVIDREAGHGLACEGKYNAHGFDTGSLRAGFETHAQAKTRLKELQSGWLELNEFRAIDPSQIRIHELVYEIFGVDFEDDEHEIMAARGALDSIDYNDRNIIKAAFPELAKLSIPNPPIPDYHTRTGNPPVPAISFSAHVIVPLEIREKFNARALAVVEPDNLPVVINGKTSAEQIHGEFCPTGLYKGSISSVAEEIGKARLGLESASLSEILYTRVYDFNETYVPAPPVDIKQLALAALRRQDPAIARALVDVLRLRAFEHAASASGSRPEAPLLESH